MKLFSSNTFIVVLFTLMLSACGGDSDSLDNQTAEVEVSASLSSQLSSQIESVTGANVSIFQMPQSSDYESIPSDPNNQITEEKVILGKMLFHETAIATEGVHELLEKTWSCASCHHVAAGFKSGIVQGIAEGGSGFGLFGETRVLTNGFDALSDDPTMVPDV